jgi:hypothetical protein
MVYRTGSGGGGLHSREPALDKSWMTGAIGSRQLADAEWAPDMCFRRSPQFQEQQRRLALY